MYEDDDTSGAAAPSDEELIDEIRQLLGEKMRLNLPEHVTPDTFLRDLCVALHAHPGWQDSDQGDMGDESGESGEEQLSEDEEDFDGSDPNFGYKDRDTSRNPSAALSSRRKLSHPRRPAMSPARGKAAANEQLRNSRML